MTESGGTGGEGQVIAGYKGEGQRGEGRHKGTMRTRGGQYKFPCMYCRVQTYVHELYSWCILVQYMPTWGTYTAVCRATCIVFMMNSSCLLACTAECRHTVRAYCTCTVPVFYTVRACIAEGIASVNSIVS